MGRDSHHGTGWSSALGSIALALGLLLTASGAARAADGGGLFDGILETMDLKTKVGPKPDFVEATHPDPSTLHFIPTGTPHPKRPFKVKSADDIEATKAALDAARDAQLKPKVPAPRGKKGDKAAKSDRIAKPDQATTPDQAASPDQAATGD